MTIQWIEMAPDDPSLQPLYDQPPCPGVNTHPWRLAIEDGQMSLGSGCQECDEVVMGPVGGEDVGMHVPVEGHLDSHTEVTGWETPEYTHWWEFVPEPLLGLATTRELLEEVAVRMEVTQNSIKGRELATLCREAIENLDGYVLDYRTSS